MDDDGRGTPSAGHEFYEASSIRKVGNKYYYVYSSTLSHELCYAVSDYPDRDFVYGGKIVSIADIGYQGNTTPLNYTGNTHGGMVNVEGQWYIFYHRQTNKRKCNRQGCAEKIEILADGSWCGFKYFSFTGAENKISVKVKGHAAGMMKVYTDQHAAPAASIPVKAQEDWGILESTFTASAGVKPLYFVFEGSGSLDFKEFEIF